MTRLIKNTSFGSSYAKKLFSRHFNSSIVFAADQQAAWKATYNIIITQYCYHTHFIKCTIATPHATDGCSFKFCHMTHAKIVNRTPNWSTRFDTHMQMPHMALNTHIILQAFTETQTKLAHDIDSWCWLSGVDRSAQAGRIKAAGL